MAFTRESTLVARVIPSPSSEVGPRPNGLADIRAIVIHMAEGGGTASWLTRPDGNSSHYVVEYDGEIVQMVPERYWAGSLNPNALRTTDDPYFTFLGERLRYGKTEAVRALGNSTGAYANPNRFVIAIEVEGFALTGPNTRQRASLQRLVADIRRRRAKPYPCLGHRDFQSYKRCPGRLIPWVDYGGHAKAATAPIIVPEVPTTTMAITGSTVPEVPTRLYMKPDPADATKSRWLYVYSDHRANAGNTQLKPIRPLLLTRFIDADTYAVAYEPATGDTNATSKEMFVKTMDIAKTEPVTIAGPDTTPYSQAQLDAAKLAAKREGYDLARAGAKLNDPPPVVSDPPATITWPTRP